MRSDRRFSVKVSVFVMPQQSTVEPVVDSRAAAGGGPRELLIVFCPAARDRNRSVGLDESEVLPIGREVSGGLNVEDLAMSRLHARVTWDAHYQTHRIGDADSANGCFVNAKRVRTAPLDVGDIIRLGDTLFVYRGSDPMEKIRERADAIAESELNVLLLGPTGAGKEVLARRVHAGSGRSGDFTAINCAAIPRELVGSELFGHAKGAFSGAASDRDGLFLTAGGGTVFLDEVGDLKPDIQAALLRVLQERTVRPIGSDREAPFRGRVISATNADLESAASSGNFRADLFARLSEVRLSLPSLRDRKAELLALLEEFLEREQAKTTLTPDSAEALLVYDWPYNVRELESLAKECGADKRLSKLDLARLEEIKPEAADPFNQGRTESDDSEPLPQSIDRDTLRSALKHHSGNVTAAARDLGKPRSFVYRWMKALGLSPRDFR